MKKFPVILFVLLSVQVAAAQNRIVPSDLEDFSEFNEFGRRQYNRVSTSFDLAFPMHFAWSTLLDRTYNGAWSAMKTVEGDFLGLDMGQSFLYSLDMCSYNFHFGVAGDFTLSLSLRWTLADFSLANTSYALMPAGGSDLLTPVSAAVRTPRYNGKKSKVHADYFGVPLVLKWKIDRIRVYAGATAEVLVRARGRYREPSVKYEIPGGNGFNRFRSTLECGISYGGLGVFASYGLTPVFDPALSDAKSFTFGIVLGL